MSRTTIWHCSASRVYLCAVFSPSDAPQNFSNIRERSFQVMFLTNASSHRRPLMPYNPLEQPHAQRCTHVNCFGSILLHSTSYPSTPLCQCILCGIAPSGGCSFLTTADYVDRDTEKLVEELGSENRKTRQIVRDMLEATDDPMANGTIGFPYSWWPDGMGHERYNEMLNVAIGHFDEDGVCEKRGELVRDGRGVELRRVDGYIGYAEFDELLRTVNGKEERVWVWSSCTVHDANPNFMLCEPCFLYLEAWLVLHQ